MQGLFRCSTTTTTESVDVLSRGLKLIALQEHDALYAVEVVV
jgi:hypothetical protein